MKKKNRLIAAALLLAAHTASAQPMMQGANGWTVSDPLLTIGETVNGYTPPGILDGIGAMELDHSTVRVFANHELLHFRGSDYAVSDGQGGTFTLKGARISYFDIDKESMEIVDAGPAYNKIYDANGNVAIDGSFQPEPYATLFGQGPGDGSQLQGFSRFCSSVLVNAGEFNKWGKPARPYAPDNGLEDTIYFSGEEDGTVFSSVGGAEWALDVATGDIWAIPAMGRGAWENIAPLDTGDKHRVAFILADDSSPFDADGDGMDEAAPLYLYIGEKDRHGNFLERNGLADGDLYVFVANNGALTPTDFNTSGKLKGRWIAIDNAGVGTPSQDGSSGFDEYGYPTQATLWTRAEALGAFGFSRPEDVAYKPGNPTVAVLASTGVDNFEIDPATGNGVDTFGTMYTIKTNFSNMKATLEIIYDGDADPSRSLRSPDNLDWADNNRIIVQEDEAEEDTASGDEVLFGADAANPNEAGVVVMDPKTGATLRVANIDRGVVLDGSIADPTLAVDGDAGAAGEWESSGVLDVSALFDKKPGSFFILNVQAHGIEDQDSVNPESRITDDDLVEGGQLLFLSAPQ